MEKKKEKVLAVVIGRLSYVVEEMTQGGYVITDLYGHTRVVWPKEVDKVVYSE